MRGVETLATTYEDKHGKNHNARGHLASSY